jgi:aspartate/methionine/tyrosine aminotransferase
LLAHPQGARYAPEARGLKSARAAVSRDYEARGASVDPDHIVLTASSSESYSLLFKLLANQGDEVLVPAPSYPLFGYLADLEGVRVRTYPLHFDHEWHPGVDSLAALVTERTRAVVVVHPNNPTGSFLKHAEAAALTSLCADRGLAIIADEVFADFAFDLDDPRRYPTFATGSAALCFALGGLSKSCGLPQMKLGWIAVSGPAELRNEALARLEFVADTYLSVATPIQLALPNILEGKTALQAPIKRRLARNQGALKTAVAAHKELSLLPIEGGWSALIKCPATRGDEDRALLALDAGVLVHPGHFFDLDPGCYLVVSLLCEPSVLDEALPALMQACVS